jgi:hypothetical protein
MHQGVEWTSEPICDVISWEDSGDVVIRGQRLQDVWFGSEGGHELDSWRLVLESQDGEVGRFLQRDRPPQSHYRHGQKPGQGRTPLWIIFSRENDIASYSVSRFAGC